MSKFQDAVEYTYQKLIIMKDGFLLERANVASPDIESFIQCHDSDITWNDSVERSKDDIELFNSLKKAASYHIKFEIKMPVPLSIWVSEYLDGIRIEPKNIRKKGRPSKIRQQEVFIAVLIRLVEREFALKISRNQSGLHTESACDVLSQAILKLYQNTNYQIQPNSYDGLLKLYRRYNKT